MVASVPGAHFQPYKGSEALREMEAYGAGGTVSYRFCPGSTTVVCQDPAVARWVREWFYRSLARGDFPQAATFEELGGDTPEVQCTVRYAVS